MKYLSTLFFVILIVTTLHAQQSFESDRGNYKIAIPEKWNVDQERELTSVSAPSAGSRVEIRHIGEEDMTLDEGFKYSFQADLPQMYNSIKVISQGEEVINGIKTKWAIFSFADSGKSMVNIFYLALKGRTFYMLNGISEKERYPKFESEFLKIIRSFEITK